MKNLLSLVLCSIIFFSCKGIMCNKTPEKKVIIEAVVISVRPLAYNSLPNRKRWEVVIKGTSDNYRNKLIKIYVHSIAKKFHRDKVEVIGKKYHFSFPHDIDLQYYGDFDVTYL